MRERSGSTFQRNKGKKNATWWARVTYLDPVTGKRHDLQRRAENKTHAKEIVAQLLNELESNGSSAIEGERMSFIDLARVYAERKLQPAQIHNGRKISGLKSLAGPQGYLKLLETYFGNRRIRTITHTDLEEYQRERLATPLKDGNQRTIAGVNRELELLRAMLNFAARQGWIIRSPFERGITIISKANEAKRDRVLTIEEEDRLLECCTGKRQHLKAIISIALDTAMRRGELLKLTWANVDFTNKIIYVCATTTKTETERVVGMTPRVEACLRELWEVSPKTDDCLVFGIKDNFKNAFSAACKAANVEGFRFHDCRHTAITRWVQSGIPAHLIMKISGHTQPITFQRYVNVTQQTAREAAEALSAFNSQARTQAKPRVEYIN